ncbi:MAG: hypothetical protein M1834_008559 [Cirrosporium novae-zelandiae]|nr:MAG: hypothetical protein M1834_008559 [Cirrosporium novae-zelandiae]
MDVFYAYTYGSAGFQAIQATPLLLTPKLIIAMLSSEARASTDLEIYLCRSLAFALFTLALLTILLSGSIPLTSTSLSVTPEEDDPKAPYAMPMVGLTGLFHTTSATYLYTQYYSTEQIGFAFGMTIDAALAALSGWILLFGNESGRISKRTGRDKRTSGWPFGNRESKRGLKEERKRI